MPATYSTACSDNSETWVWLCLPRVSASTKFPVPRCRTSMIGKRGERPHLPPVPIFPHLPPALHFPCFASGIISSVLHLRSRAVCSPPLALPSAAQTLRQPSHPRTAASRNIASKPLSRAHDKTPPLSCRSALAQRSALATSPLLLLHALSSLQTDTPVDG